MGREQRRREANGETGPRWKHVREAPKDAWPLALLCELTCSCAGHRKGGLIVITGARDKGEWVYNCEHGVKLLAFYEIPKPDRGELDSFERVLS